MGESALSEGERWGSHLQFVRVRQQVVRLVGRDLLHQLVLHIEHNFAAFAEVSYEVVQRVAVGHPGDEAGRGGERDHGVALDGQVVALTPGAAERG